MNLGAGGVVIATIVIIGMSAFFVAAEFALLAAKRHRLEDDALTSRAARAALRNASELSILLAGSQLGITVATLALGAITKPAVHDWLAPLLEGVGLPTVTADVIAFVLALFVVTFLHLVIGEMAPKSWAIAHPELSATMLAIPMRGFLIVTKPILVALNTTANWLLLRVGVRAVNSVSAAQSADSLRHLVQHSENAGALDIEYSTRLAAAIAMQSTAISALVAPGAPVTMVSPRARMRDVREATQATGHLRVLVADSGPSTRPGQARILGMVHVRDTLASPPEAPVSSILRPVLRLPAEQSIHESLAQMRRGGSHIAVVTDGSRALGVVTLSDVVRGLTEVGRPSVP